MNSCYTEPLHHLCSGARVLYSHGILFSLISVIVITEGSAVHRTNKCGQEANTSNIAQISVVKRLIQHEAKCCIGLETTL
jgi:hypothetical protein